MRGKQTLAIAVIAALLWIAAPRPASAQEGDYIINSRSSAVPQHSILLAPGLWNIFIADGAYSPWSFTTGCDPSGANCTQGYQSVFWYFLNGGTILSHGTFEVFQTADLAFANYENNVTPLQLDIASQSTLGLFISDSGYSNNRGSFTVRVQQAPTTPPTTVVPEPISMALLGTGLVGIAGVARRKNRDDDVGS